MIFRRHLRHTCANLIHHWSSGRQLDSDMSKYFQEDVIGEDVD